MLERQIRVFRSRLAVEGDNKLVKKFEGEDRRHEYTDCFQVGRAAEIGLTGGSRTW
ncbi:MAG: hypothetical protein HUJ74_03380 [Lachnospiraceae bacterium]|nr:hypothetical protein [Lachnospiraceae bacterium]